MQSPFYKQNKIVKVDISLKQLLDVDTTNELAYRRLDNIFPNQVLTSYTNTLRRDAFRFKYLTDLIQAGTGITITNNAGIITISSTGGGGGVASIDVDGGTGISVSPAGPITTSGTFTVTNTAPDQIVSLGTTGTGLAVTGAYPSFTLQNTLPDQTVALTAGTGISVTGTYPSFTINNTSPGAGGGGTGGRNYYLNGGTVQGTFGGITDMREMNPIPVVGTNVDFTINADGYIKSFITDAGDPNQTVIPAGNWNFELWFSASSGGGSPQFYVELSKWDGSTFTLIATGSGAPEGITNGTAIDLYFTALSVPQTILTSADRLALRVYVIHSGRTITLHTQDSHLCQIITTFPSGLVSLNGLTGSVQTLSTGTTGTDFGITSSGIDHVFNLPVASATNTGKLSSGDWTTFNGKADLASPAFTGNPTAPTPASGDNDTSIATTAFVTNAVQQSLSFTGYFGAGTDGSVTINGSSGSGGTVTLANDMFYNDLTIDAGGILYLNGYRIFVSGTLDLTNAGSSAIHNNGYGGVNNANTTGGAANLTGFGGRGGFGSTVYGWFIGGSGTNGKHKGGSGGIGGTASGNGSAGSSPTVLSNTEGLIGGVGGTGGVGGNSASGATGGAGATGQATGISVTNFGTYTPQTFITNPAGSGTFFNRNRQDVSNTANFNFTSTTYIYFAGGHGGGGGGGGANVSVAGNGGGAGGGGGGTTAIFARNIVVGPSTNAAAISARGGSGGNGGSHTTFNGAGSGGAGGGGGGFVYLVAGSISGTSGVTFVSANGGTGGTGGDGRGAGNFGGQGGSGGNGGKITVINMAANSVTVVNSTAVAASTAATPTGVTGTAGTAGATCTFSS